ncbi:RHS repeat-associated core domain-containing protein [Streptomyces sp. NBC_01476]|uniref:RHS repeat domain-containing protein n=1 Tax=Streptomyces sp. NBC_01476 TaxID=2903881 RepID=UPI003FCD05D9
MRNTLIRGVLLPLREQVPGGVRRRRRVPLVAALCVALVVPVGLAAPVAAADSGGGLGAPALPKSRSVKVDPVTKLGANTARARVTSGKATNTAQAKRARTEQMAAWPAEALATGHITPGAPTELTAGGLPVTITQGKGSTRATGEVQVRVLSQKEAQKAGVNGVVLTAAAADAGSAQLSVDYSAFASANGGGWSGRLRLVQLPTCALTTPQKPACRVQTPLNSHNSISGQSVTAQVSLPKQAASSAAVLALAAASGESSSGAGNYTASPLSASSTWAAGGSSGSFTWSYPMSTPPAAAGPAPDLALSYDSGSTDGKTASTNNQSTQVGEGFDLSSSSYVERSYATCDDDGQTGKFDECWKYDNASLVLNGKSTELVKDDTTGTWRLKDDDASTVTHSTGANNGDEGDTGIDGAGEYWTVTTGDGTKYVFGLNKLPGAGASDATNSVWTVPVFGDDSGEPGYSSGTSFSGRAKNQAWRWNLDYVVDLHGNAMSYWYTPETNYYAKNGATTGTASYTRGGYLDHILYGQRSDTLFTGTASDKVTFSYAERCTAADCSSLTKTTAPNWPDVPFDSICASGADCHATGPAFFTRKRLTGISTFAWNAAASPAAYTAVDSWALTQQFLDPGDIGDSSDQTLTLKSIQRTGKTGTPITLDPVTFTYQMRANRVDAPTDDILPLNLPRIASVTTETGAITSVTFSDPECVRGSNMPAAEDNDTKSCYPVYWHINGATEASIDWFHKYRVLAVVTSDPTALGQTMESAYSYSGPAWHYNDDPMTPADERTWSVWRGYRTVTTTTGVSSDTQSKTVSVYMQGMDGDKQKDGTTRSVQAAGVSFTGLSVPNITDSNQYAGFTREQVTYDGTTPVSVTLNDPWSSNTATQQKSYANIKAYYVRTAKTQTSTYLTATAGWRTHSVNTTYDSYGMPTQVNDSGQLGLNGDESCTRTWYARNTAVGITSLVSRTRTTSHVCSTAETALVLPADSTNRGDVISDNGIAYDNTAATAWSASQTPTLGEATWTGRASAYPATATGGERNPTSWQTVTKTTYDDATVKLGRILSAADAAGNTTSTAYTPTGAGPLTMIATTNAKTQKTFTYLDYARGNTVMSADVNTKLTESAYDALGRVTAVWLPNRSRGGGDGANYTYAYHVTNEAPPWTSTSTIRGNDVYNTTYTIYDSLLRPLQTQSPGANGGRLLTDTRYDSRGLAYETYADVFDSTANPSGAYARAESGRAPKQTETVFDGVGRPTTSSLYIYGDKTWTSSTSYTGDSTATTALTGGSATRTITDIFGRTTEQREYSGTDPADTAYGAGVGAAYHSTTFTYTRDGKPSTVNSPDAQWSYAYDLFGRQTSVTDPDKGTATTAYNSLDQVASTTDSRQKTLLYAYDPLGRKTDQWQTSQTNANKIATWSYDTLLKGQLDSSTRYIGGTTGTAYTQKVTAYDSLDRPTTTEIDLPATDPMVTSGAVTSKLTTSTYYNLDGTQQYINQPAAGGLNAEIVNTHYNALGLPTDVSGASNYLLGAVYNDIGQTQQLTLGISTAAGVKKAYITNTYQEGTDRLTESAVTDQTHSYPDQDLNYGYDDSGNVTHIYDHTTLGGTSTADNQCFTYDGYKRLTDAWTPATADCATTGRTTANLGGPSPYWTTYTYNDAGLRTSETSHSTTGTSALSTYCYNPARPHALTSVASAATCTGAPTTYVYDNAGDTTTRPNGTDTQSLTWTPEGQLDTLTEKSSAGATKSTTSHIYDADGNLLIRRNTSGQSVLYLGNTEVHLDTTTSTAKYWAQRYYTVGSFTIALRSNQSGTNTLTWLAADQHGTSSLALDSNTQAVTKRYTTPFGAPRTGGTGTWPDDKAFLGKATDPTSSLTYIGAREYDPTTGRFISVDPLLDTTDSQSLNGYAYADNNPATFTDPSGQMLYDDTSGLGFGTAQGLNDWYHDQGYTDSHGQATPKYEQLSFQQGVSYYVQQFTANTKPRKKPHNPLRSIVMGKLVGIGNALDEISDIANPVCWADSDFCSSGDADQFDRWAAALGADTDSDVYKAAKENGSEAAYLAAGGEYGVGGELAVPGAVSVEREVELARMLSDAARQKGMSGVGTVSKAEAEMMGAAWVGPGYRLAKDGRTMISKDKLRQYRPPSFKPNRPAEYGGPGYQANLEWRVVPEKQWQADAHLNIEEAE